jgi:membrane protease YdiL (CAAX protease family)
MNMSDETKNGPWSAIKARLVAPIWHLPIAVLFICGVVKASLALKLIPGYTAWMAAEPKLGWMLSSLFTMIVDMAIVVSGLRLYRIDLRGFIGLRHLPFKGVLKEAGVTLAAFVVMAAVYVGLYELVNLLVPSPPNEAMRAAFTAPTPFLATLNIIGFVFVAFSEEVAYRGYIQKQLLALMKFAPLAILLQGILFGLSHGYQGPSFMFLNGVAGVMFGIVAYNRKSLIPCMVIHFLNDTGSFIGMMAQSGGS